MAGAVSLLSVLGAGCSQSQSSLEMPAISKDAVKVLSKEQQKQAITELSQPKPGTAPSSAQPPLAR